MNILLSVEPEEYILGIVWWVSIIIGIIVLVKFFQIAKDVRSIKETIEDIANAIVENKGANVTPQTQKAVDAVKNTIKTNDEKQDKILQFFNECSQLYKQCHSKEEFESKVENIIAKYNKNGDFDYSTLKDGLWEQFKQL